MSVHYNTNWMGPASTHWYNMRDIPFEIRETSGKILPKTKYKHYLESYSCGRIDIRDDSKEGYAGWDEYAVPPMISKDWHALSDWLYNLQTEDQWSYDKLIEHFQYWYKKEITWAKERGKNKNG